MEVVGMNRLRELKGCWGGERKRRLRFPLRIAR